MRFIKKQLNEWSTIIVNYFGNTQLMRVSSKYFLTPYMQLLENSVPKKGHYFLNLSKELNLAPTSPNYVLTTWCPDKCSADKNSVNDPYF